MILRALNVAAWPAEEYAAALAVLPAARQRAVARLPREVDRRRTVGGEWLARQMIAARCGVDAAQIVFARQPGGKPAAVGLGTHFNVSHSGNVAVCALSDAPVGVDIERLRPINLRILSRIASPAEREYVLAVPGEETARFFEVWTVKEAFVKSRGEGIAALRRADYFAVAPTATRRSWEGYTLCAVEDRR